MGTKGGGSAAGEGSAVVQSWRGSGACGICASGGRCNLAHELGLSKSCPHILGVCTGVRKLPSQVGEKDIFPYNPESLPDNGPFKNDRLKNLSPESDLATLRNVSGGATP